MANNERDWGTYGGYMQSASCAFPVSTSISLQGFSACGDVHYSKGDLFIKSNPNNFYTPSPEPDLNSLAAKLMDHILNFAVIVPCAHCDSANAFTNPTCVQCGAPMGHNRQPKSKFG